MTIALYRIAQEATNNMVRHAHARRSWVTLTNSDEAVRLVVGDDGEGFDRATVGAEQLGLRIMRERAEAVGATSRDRERGRRRHGGRRDVVGGTGRRAVSGNAAKPKIRVMIVDDHELVRSGLENILRLFDDIELVAQVDSGAHAVGSCARRPGPTWCSWISSCRA